MSKLAFQPPAQLYKMLCGYLVQAAALSCVSSNIHHKRQSVYSLVGVTWGELCSLSGE